MGLKCGEQYVSADDLFKNRMKRRKKMRNRRTNERYKGRKRELKE